MAKHRREDGQAPTGILAALLKARHSKQSKLSTTTGWPLGNRRQRPNAGNSGWWPSRGH